jgi:hypothetical protein
MQVIPPHHKKKRQKKYNLKAGQISANLNSLESSLNDFQEVRKTFKFGKQLGL